jgi:hypothetical protein
MEELFQLIVALFVLSFPLLSALSRRRRSRRGRRNRTPEAPPREAGTEAGEPKRAAGDSARGSGGAEGRRDRREERREQRREARRRAAEDREVERQAEREAWSTAEARDRWGPPGGIPEERGASAAERGRDVLAAETPGGPGGAGRRQPAGAEVDATRLYEIGRDTRTVVSAGREKGMNRAALQRIELLPRLQQAVVWSELLRAPKGLRRRIVPWDEESD